MYLVSAYSSPVCQNASSSEMSFAPFTNVSMSTPATARGNMMPGVNAEYLPPILPGISKVT